MNKIFTLNDKDWYGFIAPEKPEYSGDKIDKGTMLRRYREAYATAKAEALPILNPEIIEFELSAEYKTIFINGDEINESEDYEWPGGMDVGTLDLYDYRGYILSLPNSAKNDQYIPTTG